MPSLIATCDGCGAQQSFDSDFGLNDHYSVCSECTDEICESCGDVDDQLCFACAKEAE